MVDLISEIALKLGKFIRSISKHPELEATGCFIVGGGNAPFWIIRQPAARSDYGGSGYNLLNSWF